METRLGLDIGGTEVKGGVVNMSTGSLIHSVSVPTNANKGVQGVKEAVAHVLENLKKACPDALKIGVASAGNINNITGSVVYATDNIPGYSGFNLGSFINSVSKLDAYCDSDAYSALKGEAHYGGAKGFCNVAMITLGTGVGGAVMLDGKIYRGSNFNAARFGHIILYPNGVKCTCGQNGCAESYVSGTALMRRAAQCNLQIKHGSEIFERMNTDSTAKSIVREFIDNLSALILSIKNTFAPDALIIGGGVINSKRYFWDELKKTCQDIKLIPAALNNTAGIVGATLYDFNY